MLDGAPRLVGHPLSSSERRDWRLVVACVGAALVMISYCLPMFDHRIIEATTRFTGGTTLSSHFPVLISRQHYNQTHRPLNEELLDVQIVIAAVEDHGSTGWGWLLYVAGLGASFPQNVSFFICLLVPLVGSVMAFALVAGAWLGPRGLPERLVPACIQLTFLALPALLLAWLHQFDFSKLLLSLGQSALTPRVGFWGGLFGMALALVGVLGLRRETRRDIVNWWALVFVAAMSVWLLTRFKPYPFLEIWRFIYDGILVTLRIVGTSFGLILIVSLFGGLGRISRSPIIYGLSSLYVELVRGIPLLVQLLFIWFALPQVFDGLGRAISAASPFFAGIGQYLIDLRLSPFTAAVFGLTFCYGAYGSEIFRAGISSIHHGQMEAARSLGMTYIQAMRYVILPQAIRVILPPVGNEFVALLKDSSLVSVLAVSDLTRRGREYMARTFLSFDTWIMVALCYLVLTLFSSRAVEFIESKSQFE